MRLNKKVCSKCGIEKDFNEFYIRKENQIKYGSNDPRSYRESCIDCCSEAAKKQREKRMNYTKGLYFVYFVYDYNNELFYIGKTNDLYSRIHQHQIENRFNEDDVYYVEFELLNSLCDASIRELYYINKYKPRLNKRDVFEGDILCTNINELIRLKVYRHNKEQFKEDINKAIKNREMNCVKSSKKYSKPVAKIDPLSLEVIQVYSTCKQAEQENNISESGVSRAAKKGGKAGGFYWEYLDAEDKSTDRYGK